MNSIKIQGGQRLKGKVVVGGAKNSCLKLMALCLLTSGECVITNVPDITDVRTMADLLRALGARVSESRGRISVDAGQVCSLAPPEPLVRRMRASIQILGPMLARHGEVRIPFPGGCRIGSRPIDLHLKGLAAMGACFSEEHGYITARARRLSGADIHLDFPSVGATENLMAAACLGDGVTVIRNAAREPEIVDQQNFLSKMGAEIRGAGTDTIRIVGVRELKPADHSVMPDRIEAGTFMIAAAATKGDVVIDGIVAEHLESVAAKLGEAGAVVIPSGDCVRVVMNDDPSALAVRSMPYPGFPTDLQAPMAVLLTMARGTSVITENIFSNRFGYSDELARMGARIQVEGRSAVIRGVPELTGARVKSPDLRGGAALVIAGLAARGETVVDEMEHVARGYGDLIEKLVSLGAFIEPIGVACAASTN